MLRRLRRAAALVLLAQLAVVGVRAVSTPCAGSCDAIENVASWSQSSDGQIAAMTVTMDAQAMPMPAQEEAPTSGVKHGAPPSDTAPAAPESCFAGANCTPPLASVSLIALADLTGPALAVSRPVPSDASMLTRDVAAPEAPPPKA